MSSKTLLCISGHNTYWCIRMAALDTQALSVQTAAQGRECYILLLLCVVLATNQSNLYYIGPTSPTNSDDHGHQ